MNAVLSAIMTKISGSTFETDVGGRVFLDRAPDGTPFPYCIFFIVSNIPDDVFNKNGRNLLIQFSLFSSSSGGTEITTMYDDLHSLLNNDTLAVTGSTLIWMHEQDLTTMVEDITVLDATQQVKVWHVDYEIVIAEEFATYDEGIGLGYGGLGGTP